MVRDRKTPGTKGPADTAQLRRPTLPRLRLYLHQDGLLPYLPVVWWDHGLWMSLTDSERNPPVIENGRVPIRVDPDRDLLNAEDQQIHQNPSGIPDGEFRLDLDDARTEEGRQDKG